MQSGDTANPLDSEGGAGDTRPSGRAKLAELRLFAHALRQGWNVPENLKKEAADRVGSILQNAKSERSWIAAARTLVSMTTATTSSIDCAVRVRAQEELADEIRALKEWRDAVEGAGNVPGD
jgi:hypothetical protein